VNQLVQAFGMLNGKIISIRINKCIVFSLKCLFETIYKMIN
jgi:hypothetical protein